MKLVFSLFFTLCTVTCVHLAADSMKSGCNCRNCQCTPESNCGCYSDQGCQCSNPKCNCGPKCACGPNCQCGNGKRGENCKCGPNCQCMNKKGVSSDQAENPQLGKMQKNSGAGQSASANANRRPMESSGQNRN